MWNILGKRMLQGLGIPKELNKKQKDFRLKKRKQAKHSRKRGKK